MIIDGTNLVLGRLASFAAKQALLAEKVIIVNCEKVYISGNKDNIKQKYKERTDRGNPSSGPYQPRKSDRLVRRTIRGMLPYKQKRGIEAYKRVNCFIGLPPQFKNEKLETLKNANISKFSTMNYISIGELSKYIGN